MRSLLIGAALVAGSIAPLITLAAETFTVPITVVPGSAYIGISTEPDTPVSFPFSQFLQSPSCSAAGTFSASIVNGGLEVEIDGAASSVPGGGACQLLARSKMEIEIRVPELGGTVTMVRLEAEPLVEDFSSLSFARAEFVSRESGTSSSLTVPFRTDGLDWRAHWDPHAGFGIESVAVQLKALIPGDTVRIQIEVSDLISSNAGIPTQGTLRVRYTIKTTVPELSSALSLPVGALTIFGLAARRG